MPPTSKQVNERYLAKFHWSQPELIDTELGKRIRRWALITPTDKEDYLSNQPKFAPFGVTMKDHGGKLYFYRWSKPELSTEEKQKVQDASRSVHSSMEIPAPAGLAYDPYQKAAIEFTLARNATLIGDEQGLGKSVEAIGYINAYNARAGKRALQRILVVCPAHLRLNWKYELDRWLVHDYSVEIVEGGFFPSSDIVIISYQSISRYEKELTFLWCLAIVDECQYVSNPEAKMTRALCGYIPKRTDSEGVIKAGIPCRRKIAMTGTPIRNRPRDYYSILRWLDPVTWPSRNQFLMRYCGAMDKGYWDDSGSSHEIELQQILRSTIMIRRLKSDVLKDLPPKRRSIIVLPVDHKEMEKIGELARAPRMIEWSNRVEAAKVDLEIAKCLGGVASAVDRLDRLMGEQSSSFELLHQIARAKTTAAIEIFKREMESTPKFVIFAHHQDVIDRIKAEIPQALVINGSISQDLRNSAVQTFQTSPESGPIIVGIKCASGITLTAASREYFLERSWLPGEIAQAEDRCMDGESIVYCRQAENNLKASLVAIKDVKIGDRVLTHAGRYSEVTDTWNRQHRGLITSIDYIGWFDPIICTSDHRMLIKRGGKVQWLEASSILPGDFLAFPKQVELTPIQEVFIKDEWRVYKTVEKPSHCINPGCKSSIEARSLCRVHYREELNLKVRPRKPAQINPRHVRLPDRIKIDEDWLYLFGWFLAEGFSSLLPGKSKFISFSGHQKERFILERIAKTISSLGVKSTIYENKKTLGIEMRSYSAELAMWFSEWFGGYSSGISVPDELMNIPPHQAAVLLRGYTDGDGYQRNRSVEWVSASKNLCYQMCVLAVRSGFVSSMRKGSGKSGSHWIGGYSKFPKNQNRFNNQDVNYSYRPVTSVRTSYAKQKVYDITVEGDHSFVTGFATAHNCHRRGQLESVDVMHLVLEGSIDFTQANSVIRKQQAIDRMLDYKPDEVEAMEPVIPMPGFTATASALDKEAKQFRESAHSSILSAIESSRPIWGKLSHLDQRIMTKIRETPIPLNPGFGYFRLAALASLIAKQHLPPSLPGSLGYPASSSSPAAARQAA